RAVEIGEHVWLRLAQVVDAQTNKRLLAPRTHLQDAVGTRELGQVGNALGPEAHQAPLRNRKPQCTVGSLTFHRTSSRSSGSSMASAARRDAQPAARAARRTRPPRSIPSAVGARGTLAPAATRMT